MRIKYSLAIYLVIFCLQGQAMNLSGNANTKVPAYGFIENKGQIMDQNRLPNPEVLYLLKGKGLHVQLKQSGFSYEVERVEGAKSETENTNFKSKNDHSEIVPKYKIHRIDLQFSGANKNPEIITYEPAPDKINYFLDGSRITRVNHFQKIIYKNIYPQIDVEYLADPALGKFKYNFILHPHANINGIRIKLQGALKTSLTRTSQILIESAYGNILESIPFSYQTDGITETKEVKAYFKKLDENEFGISAIDYNPSKTLIIDPSPWATYYGGSANDYGWTLATDGNGNGIVSGWTTSSNAIATSGAYQTILLGTSDAFIAKFSSSGSLLWASYFGGAAGDFSHAITTDNNNNIILTGNTGSSSGIATTGAYQTIPGNASDAFVAKFNAAGNLLWSTYYGGAGTDMGEGLATDANRNIFLSGNTQSSSGIFTSGAYQPTYAGGNDGFLVKLNENGFPQWGTYFGGTLDDNFSNMKMDEQGNLLLIGNTKSTTGIASSGAFQTSLSGGTDALVVKFSKTGSLLWSTYFGGSLEDLGNNISNDGTGHIYFTGYTGSTSGIATAGSYMTIPGGTFDAFVAKFDSLGVLQWGTYFGGASYDYGNGIDVDFSGNIVITGSTGSTGGIATGSAFQSTNAGGGDAFIAQFNSNGTLQYGTYFGGTGYDAGVEIRRDVIGNFFMAGYTSTTSGIIPPGAYQFTFGGGYDVLMIYFASSAPATPISNNSIGASQGLCLGGTPLPLSGTLPLGGDANYAYTWLNSQTSAISGFAPAFGLNNTQNYTPGILSNTTWYKRVVSSAGFYDTSNVIVVTVGSKPVVGFTINKGIQCLKDNRFVFTDTSTNVAGVSRLWNFGNGDTSTLSNPIMSYAYSVNNSHWVKLVVSLGTGCADSISKLVHVLNNPNTSAIKGDKDVDRMSTETYSVNSTLGSSYKWMFTNGTGTSSASLINITWKKNGSDTLRLLETSGGGCLGDTVTKIISIISPLGFDPVLSKEEYQIYPNPTRDFLHIVQDDDQLTTIAVYDLPGNLVLKETSLLKEFQMDLSSLQSGIYTIQLSKENGSRAHFKVQILK